MSYSNCTKRKLEKGNYFINKCKDYMIVGIITGYEGDYYLFKLLHFNIDKNRVSVLDYRNLINRHRFSYDSAFAHSCKTFKDLDEMMVELL